MSNPHEIEEQETRSATPDSIRSFREAFTSWLGRTRRKTHEELSKPAMSRRTLLFGCLVIAAAATAEDRLKIIDSFLNGNERDVPTPGRSTDVLLASEEALTYVKSYKDLAVELSKSADQPIPYEVFLAVSMHESNFGTSELSQKANNYFGVIAKDGWKGAVYEKLTEEQIISGDLASLKKNHPEIKVLKNNGDGTLRVTYTRPFRKYSSPEESFKDFAKKLYYKENDGTYRYSDVVSYLKDGGRNPYRVVDLMSDHDQPGELSYATGSEWQNNVPRLIATVQTITNLISAPAENGEKVPDVTLPEKQGSIKVASIKFDSILNDKLHPDKNKGVVDAMKQGFGAASKERFDTYCSSMIKDRSGDAKAAFGPVYDKFLGVPFQPGELKYIVLHLWSVGMKDGETEGKSKSVYMSTMMKSWADADKDPAQKHASIQYMLSNNPDGELWRLTDSEFNKAAHVGYGIQDEAGRASHPDVGNGNSIGIETQADSIYNVSAKQFECILYWTTKMLLDSGIVSKGMPRSSVNDIIDKTVIGHGKNGGREFGYQFTRPIISAVQQFVFIAVNG